MSIKLTKPLMIVMVSLMVGFSLSINAQSGEKIRLIIRGDDIGVAHSVNQAIIDAYTQGILQCTEVVVPGPWFPEAIELLNTHSGLEVGVHLVLTSEWDKLKWRPITSCPSLVDDLGYFYPFIWPNEHYGKDQALSSMDWKLDEIEQELRKQIELAISVLPNVTHLSTHMGFGSLHHSVGNLVDQLGKEYGLDISPSELGVQRLDLGTKPTNGEELVEAFIEAIKNLGPGDYLFVTHPDVDHPESRAMGHKGYTIDRYADRKLLTDKLVRDAINQYGVELIPYKALIE